MSTAELASATSAPEPPPRAASPTPTRTVPCGADERGSTSTWTLTGDPARGAAAPRVAEVETSPGMHTASACLADSRNRPALHLVVATGSHADIGAPGGRIDTEAPPRPRQALDLEHLPADRLLHLDRAHDSRI